MMEQQPRKKMRMWMQQYFSGKSRRMWSVATMVIGTATVVMLLLLAQQSMRSEMPPQAPLQDTGVGRDNVAKEKGTQSTPVSSSSTMPPLEEAVPVQANITKLESPVADPTKMRIVQTFFRPDPLDEEEVAVTQQEDTFRPHLGIDFAHPNGETFAVMAALSGHVTRVETSSAWGTTIEIDHGSQMKTVYQSVRDPQVRVGDAVNLGQVIAHAGTSSIETAQGVHVHFEVWSDGKPTDPVTWLP